MKDNYLLLAEVCLLDCVLSVYFELNKVIRKVEIYPRLYHYQMVQNHSEEMFHVCRVDMNSLSSENRIDQKLFPTFLSDFFANDWILKGNLESISMKMTLPCDVKPES